MKKDVSELIFYAIDEVNEQLPFEMRLEKTDNEKIYGDSGKLDSLGIVNLITEIEKIIELNLGQSLIIFDENLLSKKENPLETVGTLINYISTLLNNK